MKWIKIEVEIAEKDNGQILIRKDSCIVGIKDIMDNANIISFFDVEIKHANKKDKG